ncbi:MAG: hypothetical protein Q8S73_01595 [Deltaproteobacteria bacterium]|nr:hypothetical protein [Deltaproteobacteria bacterium]
MRTQAEAVRWLAVALAVLAGCRRSNPHPTPARRRGATSVTAPRGGAGWTAVYRLRHRPVATHDLPDVVVHAPPGFDPSRPLHVVMVFHGLNSRPAWLVTAGPLAPLTGEPGSGWGLSTRHDRAGINALLVAPQLAPRGAAGFAGAFQRPGFLREFLNELLTETLVSRLGGRRSVDDIEGLTLVGSSGGGPVIGALLARSDLADRVRTVVLDDGLYGAESAFAAWMQRSTSNAPRRFVCLTSNDDVDMRRRADGLAARLRGQGTQVAMQPDGALANAVREHGAVFMTAACGHGGLTGATYDKVLSAVGIGVRERAAGEVAREPARPARSVGELTLGAASTRGTFARGDAMLDDWTGFDDWTLAVTAGQRLRIDVRGGRTRSHGCAAHDVEVSVLDGDRVLARDDDGGGGWNARARFTATRDGSVTVRVTERETWGVEGAYSVRAAIDGP